MARYRPVQSPSSQAFPPALSGRPVRHAPDRIGAPSGMSVHDWLDSPMASRVSRRLAAITESATLAVDAKAKALKGDERKAFMSECLKK